MTTPQQPAAEAQDRETLTSGQRAEISISECRHRLKVLFEENESRIAPDTALRSGLLDADRLLDEHAAVLPVREVVPFTEERRAAAIKETLTGGNVPLPDKVTPEALAQYVEAMVCSFLGWPGNKCSDAEVVFKISLGALRRMQGLALKAAPLTPEKQSPVSVPPAPAPQEDQKALRAAALEEAAVLVEAAEEGAHGQDYQLGDVGEFRHRVAAGIRALSDSPASQPSPPPAGDGAQPIMQSTKEIENEPRHKSIRGAEGNDRRAAQDAVAAGRLAGAEALDRADGGRARGSEGLHVQGGLHERDDTGAGARQDSDPAAGDGALREALDEANGLLRSAYSITVRKGADTNWDGIQKQIEVALARQHIIMFPDAHGPDGICKSGCAALAGQPAQQNQTQNQLTGKKG